VALLQHLMTIHLSIADRFSSRYGVASVGYGEELMSACESEMRYLKSQNTKARIPDVKN